MDRRKGQRFALYGCSEIEQHFRNCPDSIFTKRGYELLVGAVLSRCKNLLTGEDLAIGFQVKGPFRNKQPLIRPTISELIGNSSLVEDDDIDIYMTGADQHAFQITLLEDRQVDIHGANALKERLEAKCGKQAHSDYIQLAVLAHSAGTANPEEIRQFLKSLQCPYRRVYFIGQFGMKPRSGEFTCVELFPEAGATNTVHLNLG